MAFRTEPDSLDAPPYKAVCGRCQFLRPAHLDARKPFRQGGQRRGHFEKLGALGRCHPAGISGLLERRCPNPIETLTRTVVNNSVSHTISMPAYPVAGLIVSGTSPTPIPSPSPIPLRRLFAPAAPTPLPRPMPFRN